LTEQGAVKARIQVVEKALDQLAALEKRAVEATDTGPTIWIKVLLWAAAVALAVGSALLRHAVLSPLLAFLAVIVALLALTAGRVIFGRRAPVNPVQETFDEQQTRLTGDLEAFRLHRRELETAIAADAAILNLPPQPTPADVEAAAERVARAREARDARARQARELAA